MRGLSIKIMMPVAIGFVITIIVVAIYLSNALKTNTVETNIMNADDIISQYRSLRRYYTNNVVAKVKGSSKLNVSMEHKAAENTIPLPATMIHDLSKELDLNNVRAKIKLYSSHPFPNRKSRLMDNFSKDALDYLEKNPDGRFVRHEQIGRNEFVRVARADRLSSRTCVNCHNNHPQSPKTDWKLGQVRGVLEVSTPINEQLESNTSNLFQGIFILLIAGFGVLGGLFFSINKVIKPIRKIIDNLSSGSDNLWGASMEIANFSQGLSDSTTAQASNIEETSSAMEEMASMANQNADHANSANQSVEGSRNALEKGSRSVTDMSKSMAEITVAFEKINSIVRSIDEIAFETNLLSLNASLEATDAGESGKRFAVVADEVRALSDKASEAAQETVALIDGAHQRISSGNEIFDSLKEGFGEVEQSAKQVASLVSEIKAASNEQALGCEQVNRALIQLDRGTQENSSSSQQASAAADRLADQAHNIRKIVNQLNMLVSGQSSNEKTSINFNGNSATSSMKIAPSLISEMSSLSKVSSGVTDLANKGLSKSKYKAASDSDFKQF